MQSFIIYYSITIMALKYHHGATEVLLLYYYDYTTTTTPTTTTTSAEALRLGPAAAGEAPVARRRSWPPRGES